MARDREVDSAEGSFEKIQLDGLFAQQPFELSDAFFAPIARGLRWRPLSGRRASPAALQPAYALGAIGVPPTIQHAALDLQLAAHSRPTFPGQQPPCRRLLELSMEL